MEFFLHVFESIGFKIKDHLTVLFQWTNCSFRSITRRDLLKLPLFVLCFRHASARKIYHFMLTRMTMVHWFRGRFSQLIIWCKLNACVISLRYNFPFQHRLQPSSQVSNHRLGVLGAHIIICCSIKQGTSTTTRWIIAVRRYIFNRLLKLRRRA